MSGSIEYILIYFGAKKNDYVSIVSMKNIIHVLACVILIVFI